MQNAVLNDYRSLGSSQNPSGRFRKVSIGITVEKSPNICPGLRKEDTVSSTTMARTSSHQVTEENTGRGIAEILERNESETENHRSSAWLSTRSRHLEMPNADSIKFFVNQASAHQSEDGMQKKYGTLAYGKRRENDGNIERVEEVAFSLMKEMKYGENANAGGECEKVVKCTEKRLNTITYGNKRQKNGDVEKSREVAFSTNLGKENEKEPEKMVKGNTQSLGMKLSKMLGTAPSQNNDPLNSSEFVEHEESLNTNRNRTGEIKKGKLPKTKLNSVDLKKNKENLNLNQNMEPDEDRPARVKLHPQKYEENNENLNIRKHMENQKVKAARAKQNFDTIETDSESPGQVMRRPVTRSLTRKKGQPKRSPKLQGYASYGKKLLSSSSFDFKLQLEKPNIFTFDELEGKANSTSSSHQSRSKDKITGQTTSKIGQKKVCIPRPTSTKNLQNSNKEQFKRSFDKSVAGSKKRGVSSLPRQAKEKLLQTADGAPNDSHYSGRHVQLNFGSPLPAYSRETHENTGNPLSKVRNLSMGHKKDPPEPKNTLLHDNAAGGSIRRETVQLDDFHNPTLAMNVSPTSPSKPDYEVLHTPVAARPGNETRNGDSEDLGNSTPGSSQPDSPTESSDDTRDTDNQEDVESPLVDCEETEKQSLSTREEQVTESDADGFTNQEFGSNDKWFPSAESPEKSPLPIHCTKRVRSLSNTKKQKVNLPLPSKIGTLRTKETIGPFEDVKQYTESSLESCVAQLSLVLEGFRTKMKSQTCKKGSEILSAARDRIHQQIQDVESQIMSDVGKLNSIGRSKRKRLESRFQEQQEMLKVTHDKFKEEVSKNLLDCKSTLEELDTCNMELKGSLEKQRASHRKLLQQTAQTLEAQIKVAEASIAAIDKDARKKMTGLKSALKEWMN